ncbi:hypothetical protein MKY95_10095 [Paenibacillus sp. FSL P4-0176]|uniref:hypothetical protein n=1 Tax=Paenibacillus sp. FSL P4-0176 TaxID=2921631 RepID=UPI0030CFF1FF
MANIDPSIEREYGANENHLDIDSFISQMFSKGIVNTVDAKLLKKYFSSPDAYQKEIEGVVQYFYIAYAEVSQMIELVRTLPSLNYKTGVFESSNKHEINLSTINKFMYKIKHKSLTRDIAVQEVVAGSLVGMWMGEKNNLYPVVFDNLKYIYPSHRIQGEWVAVMDLAYFDDLVELNENQKIAQAEAYMKYIPNLNYRKYLTDKTNNDLRYIELPSERTFVLRTRTAKRNQKLGTSWGTTGLMDIIHKDHLKNMEKSVANKIINALAVLTVGSEKNSKYANLELRKDVKRKIHQGVKNGLDKNDANGVTLLTIPEFANLVFPDMKSEALDPDKFDSVNTDIQSSYGLSPAILNGTGSNFSSAKLNLEIMYKRIGVLLEDIEREVYGKLLNLILPNKEKDNYYIEYDKNMPISGDKRLEMLYKLHSEGFAVKPIIDTLEGLNFNEYTEQSMHELEILKLQEKIKPYATSHTSSSSVDSGRNELSDSELENENTIKTRTLDANNAPDS